MSRLYHISRAGQEIGRYSLADLEKAIRLGKVHASDYCWFDGMPGWEPVSSVLPNSASAPSPAPSTAPAAPRAALHGLDGPGAMICSRCGISGPANGFKDSDLLPRGSASYWIAIVLCFPVSILYYLHVEQKHKQAASCRGCGADALVPVVSPLGQDLLSRSRKRT